MLYDVKKQLLPNGETVAYREAGAETNGPALILIHGNQSSSLYYEFLMKEFEARAHIYAIDMAGFGDSSYRSPHTSMKDWADDTAQFMDALGIKRAVVAGWSAGGGTALELAACYPGKVCQLVLLASVGVKGFLLPKRNPDMSIVPGEYLSRREDVIKDPAILIPITRAIQTKDAAFLHSVWEKTIFNLNPPKEDVFASYMNAILQERCFVDISVALCQFNMTHEKAVVDGTGRISDIRCPVTWVHGKQDLVVPFSVGEDSVRYFTSRVRLVPIENAGHASFMDQPAEFHKILEEVLTSSN